MILEIEHHLSFDYDAFIRESFIELRMQPKTTEHQTLASFVLAVGPPSTIARYRDWNDNAVHHFTVTQYHNRIAVEGRALVRTHPAAPAATGLADPVPLADVPPSLYDFMQLAGPVRPSAALSDLHQEVRRGAGATLGDLVGAAGAALAGRFEYQKNVTRYDSTTDDFLKLGAGVCQDFAHLMLGLLRLSHVPCRYVSGYLHVDPQAGEAAQSHAWLEVYSPDRGWVPFDPTHNRAVDERYVVVGHGRHYDDVPPNKGIFRGNARETLTAEVYTRPSADKAVSTLHEEVAQIDLPVFQEIPERRRATGFDVAMAPAIQQQEQDEQQ
ncbi:MAG: transglutaminase family protein [Candidatus Rokuibacteriota bacterium]